MRLGRFDAAFLPVNGPVVDLPHRQPPSTLPAAMDPRQAAEAAALLRTGVAVPIHYGTLHRPPTYSQVDRPAETFLDCASMRGVQARILTPGDRMELGGAFPSPVAD